MHIIFWSKNLRGREHKEEQGERECIQKFPDWVDNEIKNNKHSLRSHTKDYGDKTH